MTDYGNGIKVYPFTQIEDFCSIGKDVVVGSNVFVGKDTVIGARTRIQHGAFICRGAKIGEGVFIGPLAVLTDDKYPVVGTVQPHSEYQYDAQPPVLEDHCSIGAGAIILPGVTIGAGAMIGAGAVVSKDVLAWATVMGVPAARKHPDPVVVKVKPIDGEHT